MPTGEHRARSLEMVYFISRNAIFIGSIYFFSILKMYWCLKAKGKKLQETIMVEYKISTRRGSIESISVWL